MSTITAMRESAADLKKRIAQALCPRLVTAEGDRESLETVFEELCRSMGIEPTPDMWEMFEQDYKEWAQEISGYGYTPTPRDFVEHHFDQREDEFATDYPRHEDKWEPRKIDPNDPHRPLNDQELLNYKANPITDRPDLHAFAWPEGKPPPTEIPLETKNQWKVWEGENHSVVKLPNDPAVYQREGFDMGHCVAGETKVLTYDGVFPIRDLVGKIARVLTWGKGRSWIGAEFKSFGVQRLMKVVLTRNQDERVVYATPEHRWFVHYYFGVAHKRNNRVVTTSELKQGDRIPSIYRPKRVPFISETPRGISLSSVGVMHGVVFGDGHKCDCENQDAVRPSQITLYGKKDAELLKWFPATSRTKPSAQSIGGITVHDLPRFFKELPSLNESPSYLIGWLAGYFAADGNMGENGHANLWSSNRKNLEFAEIICQRYGFQTLQITERERVGYGVKSMIYGLSFAIGSLPSEFFLISAHRERVVARKNRPVDWAVKSVEMTDRNEEVFCAVVPETGNFVLEGNILTGNCLQFLHERYAEAAKKGDIELYSMIDSKTGKPVVDIELAVKHGYGVHRAVEKPTVMQVRGYQNQCPPADEYMGDLMAFLKSYGADWDTTHNMRNFDGKPDAQLTNQRWDEMQGNRTARLLTAATLEETIAGLQQAGVPADVVEFVKGQKDTSMQGRMVGELKKNPQATVDQLKEILKANAPKRELPPHIFYKKKYPKLDEKVLNLILRADPSTPANPNATPPTRAVIVPWLNKFVPWLLAQEASNPEQFASIDAWLDQDHANAIAQTIKTFYERSNKPWFQGSRDILQYKSYRDLQDVIDRNPLPTKDKVEFVPRQKVSGKNLVAEYTPPAGPGKRSSTFKLWIVTTYKDARELSKHPTIPYERSWCFAWSEAQHGPDHFNTYSGYGFIYIITKDNIPYMAINAGNSIELAGKKPMQGDEIAEVEPLLALLPKMPKPKRAWGKGYEEHIDEHAMYKYGHSWDEEKRKKIPKGTNAWGYKIGGEKPTPTPVVPAKPARAPRRAELHTAASIIDERVVDAWRAGVPKNGSGGPGKPSIVKYETLDDYRLRTDGNDLFSYGHRIGETWPDGTKVAYDCKWSKTTKRHCDAARVVAGYHRDTCPTCHPEAKEPDANNI